MIIEVNDLWRVYLAGEQPVEALRGVTLSASGGEFVSLVGHSGSGKSTLLSMIGGLARPTRGTVMIDGDDIWARDDDFRSMLRNRKIGFVFQFASLIPTLTALDNVVLPQMFSGTGVDRPNYREGRRLLEVVGLADKTSAYPNELSGGQQRRVALARALVNRPTLILADEPTGDLDEDTETEIMDLLGRTARELNAVLLMATHNRAIAETADRMLRLKDGRLA